MKLWNEQGSSWNFKQKLLLMEAEQQYSCGNLQLASVKYDDAIKFSRLHKFVNDEALACEIAARFYSEIGELTASMKYFRLARKKYTEWGALGKVHLLFDEMEEKFASHLRT